MEKASLRHKNECKEMKIKYEKNKYSKIQLKTTHATMRKQKASSTIINI